MNLPESVDSHPDVVVIGGGLLGCAASYYLSQGGARVVLLEKEQLNRQASGQNAGSLHFQLEHRMVEHGDALAKQFALSIPLVLDAVARWSDLEAELGEDLEIVQEGGFIVAETRGRLSQCEPSGDSGGAQHDGYRGGATDHLSPGATRGPPPLDETDA